MRSDPKLLRTPSSSANGEKLRVPHADFAWIHPGKRSVVVALKGDVVRIVNWQMVTAIETKASAV